MSLKKETKRKKAADKLDAYETQINQTFLMLDSLKTGLNNLKLHVESKPAIYDATDVSEVDAAIAKIDAKYTP